MVLGFIDMGLDHGQGYELAHRCGRSLTILKRLIKNAPVADPMGGACDCTLNQRFSPVVGPATSPPTAMLKELGGYATYGMLEILMPTLGMPDRPVDREAECGRYVHRWTLFISTAGSLPMTT
jgi:hypothetical protein